MPETHYLGQVTQKALIERDGKFLFIKYPDHKPHFAGYWDLPGGRLNENVKPLQGLAREVREEVGLEIVIGNVLGVDTFTNHSEKKNYLVLFRATLLDETSQCALDPEAAGSSAWLTREEIMELPIYYPEHQELVRRLIRESKL